MKGTKYEINKEKCYKVTDLYMYIYLLTYCFYVINYVELSDYVVISIIYIKKCIFNYT